MNAILLHFLYFLLFFNLDDHHRGYFWRWSCSWLRFASVSGV